MPHRQTRETRSLNDRLCAGSLELSDDDIKVLTDEADRWLRKDKGVLLVGNQKRRRDGRRMVDDPEVPAKPRRPGLSAVSCR